ncbi:ABC transporter permease [Aminicella lysinilytica]|uniref:ABC transporter permease n=1 Tax=Aminicella lysinilytica TaxID=433323 RepID=UPI0026EE7404|nr:ABC transporter permease [Aminicella lysinilytica]
MRTFIEILKDHVTYGRQLIKLAKADIIKTYRGAALGWAWAVIRPAVTIFVFWFAFSIGIKKGAPVDGHPYFLWLIAGFTPWFYMRDTLNGGAASIRRYKYLVKRIKYPVDTIPTFVSMSNLVTNLALQCIMIAIYIGFGDYPTIYYLQLPFYILIMFIFFTAWSLFAGVLSAMSKDFLNLVKAFVPALFWLSGILYDATKIDYVWIKNILMFNPVTLIANGYRNTLIYHRWFWETPTELRNFVIVTVIMIILACWAYKKLRKEIPDVI